MDSNKEKYYFRLAQKKVYRRAITLYAEHHASNYLNGGTECAYGVNKFDCKSFGVTEKQARQDYIKAFESYISKNGGGIK